LPGEQAQVDWGHFGKLTIGKAERTLMAFVMVLSFSRQICLRFFLDARMSNFLRGHEAAFQAWGGLPRVLLYDFVPRNKINRLLNGLRSRAFKSIELSRGFPAAEDYGDCKVPTAANLG
jgi:transposase